MSAVVVIVVAEASAPKVYPRVTLASASTLSGSVVRTLDKGWTRTSKDILSSCIKPGAPSQPGFDCLRLLFANGTQRVYGGAEEIGVGFQQRSVAGSQGGRP